jgi:protocatechuate 4,5-dioxygenase, alpha chain
VPESRGEIEGTYVFDLATSRRGYALSRLGMSLTDPDNRAAFVADEDAYLARFSLTPQQRALVKGRDWLGLVKAGANIYYLFKITALLKPSLSMAELGAAQVGLSVDEFMRRNLARGEEPWRD